MPAIAIQVSLAPLLDLIVRANLLGQAQVA